jgi:hypothetical protein
VWGTQVYFLSVVWATRRYYDFNVYTRAKLKEKLEYMHANPVKEKLVAHPREWPWSSWTFYATGEGLLKMDAV